MLDYTFYLLPSKMVQDMTDLQIMLVLVASIWAAVNTVIAGYNAVNGTRDRIITGHTDEGIPMTLKHRELSLRNDWLPMKFGIALISLMFAMFLAFLPQMAEQISELKFICWIAAVVPLFSFITFFVLGIGDYRAMREVLKEARGV
jgi:hypothetical protein